MYSVWFDYFNILIVVLAYFEWFIAVKLWLKRSHRFIVCLSFTNIDSKYLKETHNMGVGDDERLYVMLHAVEYLRCILRKQNKWLACFNAICPIPLHEYFLFQFRVEVNRNIFGVHYY